MALSAQSVEPARDLVELHLAELRTAITPVFGYLEVLRELPDLPADERERMWGVVERRLSDVREHAGQLAEDCRERQRRALAGAPVADAPVADAEP